MPVIFDTQNNLFHLKGGGISYVIQLVHGGYLCHVYWGREIADCRLSAPIAFIDRAFSPNPDPTDRAFSPDNIPLEYPCYGNGDFRSPAVHIQSQDGSTITELKYVSHKIVKGKPMPEGLPATYTENGDNAETLEIETADLLTGLHVFLFYTIFEDYGVIARRVRFENCGTQKLHILKAMSANVDFRDDAFDMVTLYGAHANERNIERHPLFAGTQSIESARGASSHQQNPFFALLRQGTTEDTGEVYAMSLIYSGNFAAQVQVDQFKTARASIGINPFDFSWLLESGAYFETPEVVMTFSAEGMGGMSRTMHSLYRSRLCRGRYRDAERPILINNWEATYFNFDAEKIIDIARQGNELGIELMVLDDGWFGHRNDDTSSLGDWIADTSKLDKGLTDLADRITSTGMKFGLWFEPEMVSPDSELYRQHEDWCIHVEGRGRSQVRSQLVLDLSRPEVCNYIIESVSAILRSAKISYVKWDMNRHMTETGSAALPPERQRETAHRYMLGLYNLLEVITSRFPDVLFECCSGGGGRFDPGMLYYMPQTWTSDNTDAICRLKIQFGTSLVYPASTICSHVSAVPNHQVGRVTPLKTRGIAAMAGNFGYELDPAKLTTEEKELVKQQITLYKELRPLIFSGNMYRLVSPFEGNECGFMFVSHDLSAAAVYFFRVLSQPSAPVRILRLRGLCPDWLYNCEEQGKAFGGDELMNVGITLPQMEGDFSSMLLRLKRI